MDSRASHEELKKVPPSPSTPLVLRSLRPSVLDPCPRRRPSAFPLPRRSANLVRRPSSSCAARQPRSRSAAQETASTRVTSTQLSRRRSRDGSACAARRGRKSPRRPEQKGSNGAHGVSCERHGVSARLPLLRCCLSWPLPLRCGALERRGSLRHHVSRLCNAGYQELERQDWERVRRQRQRRAAGHGRRGRHAEPATIAPALRVRAV